MSRPTPPPSRVSTSSDVRVQASSRPPARSHSLPSSEARPASRVRRRAGPGEHGSLHPDAAGHVGARRRPDRAKSLPICRNQNGLIPQKVFHLAHSEMSLSWACCLALVDRLRSWSRRGKQTTPSGDRPLTGAGTQGMLYFRDVVERANSARGQSKFLISIRAVDGFKTGGTGTWKSLDNSRTPAGMTGLTAGSSDPPQPLSLETDNPRNMPPQTPEAYRQLQANGVFGDTTRSFKRTFGGGKLVRAGDFRVNSLLHRHIVTRRTKVG